MLRFVTGPIHGKRNDVFKGFIKNACDRGENVLVIVPDQYSFEYDKELYELLGAAQFNKIRTAGFNRLAELISRSCGENAGENANENAKIITMYKAVRRLKETGDVRFYKRALEKGSFISEALRLIEELIRSGVGANALWLVAEKSEGTAGGKLFDIARIYEFYLEELDKAGLKDSLTSMAKCASLAERNKYFEGMTVFVEAFTSFSFDEYKMLELMLKEGRSLTVSLVLSEENNGKSTRTPFAQTVRTRERLKRIASDCGSAVEYYPCEDITSCRSEIAHISKNLYAANPEKLGTCDGIRVLSANEIYEESEYVCAEIRRLVREEGMRFGEIAVAARDTSACAAVLEGTFERYDIPYFIDSAVSAEQTALVIYLKSLFEAVLTREYRTENILRCIKSPLCPILDYEISAIEDYCTRWDVRGDMWLSDFTAHTSADDSPELVNNVRRKIIEPLERFKTSCRDATAGEICKALYELLETVELSQQVYSVVKRAGGSSNDTELELGRQSKQLWQSVLGAVKAVYEQMGDEKITLRRFYELFRIMVSVIRVSAPPQKVDSVRCAGAERSRLTDVRALFVIEVNEGSFPADVKPKGLLTERDRRLLERESIELGESLVNMVENERLTAYQTFAMPTDRLYVISSESDLAGNLKKPSPLVGMILGMLENPDYTKIQDIEPEFFCVSRKSAYYKYLERFKDGRVMIKSGDDNADKKSADRRLMRRADEIASIKTALMSDKIYAEKIARTESNVLQKPITISRDTSKRLFFEHDLNVSATRITDYYKCPFMFFAKYGLKLFKPQKIKLDGQHRGSILHRCMEMILSRDGEGRRVYNPEFESMSDERLRQEINKCFEQYQQEEMGGDYGKNRRYELDTERYKDTAFKLIKLLQTDIGGSLFKPEAFEFNLTKQNNESILQIKLDEGYTINVRGSVDRADIYTDENGVRYLRIVDYKTGTTKFAIEDLYSGLNMQMMIYLLALTESVNELNPDGKAVPSGIMYSHIRELEAKSKPAESVDEEELGKTQASENKPDGLMIDKPSVIEALNKMYDGGFTIFKFTKKGAIDGHGAKPVTESYLKALEGFVKDKIIEFAQKLLQGSFEAVPYQKGEGSSAVRPCTYCDSYSVCPNASTKNVRQIRSKLDKQRLDEEIKRREEAG